MKFKRSEHPTPNTENQEYIPMLNLKAQYQNLKLEIDTVMLEVCVSGQFIGGSKVEEFANELGEFMDCKHVIPCANGTDALTIALMACELERGDEVIMPSFTYAATAEACALLGLKPVFVDVTADTFCISVDLIEEKITERTKVIMPVHLFGQCAAMEDVLILARKYNLVVIEDNAQSLGADVIFRNGFQRKGGTVGQMGCTSFFPSKVLGAYGDGGALFTNDDSLAEKCKMIANHGQSKKYYHSKIGLNSRLDALQAVILQVKLQYLPEWIEKRQLIAGSYQEALFDISQIVLPITDTHSTHVFHQYTIRVKENHRDTLKQYLEHKGIASMIYYPLPIHQQIAYHTNVYCPVSEQLCQEVLSLPICSEMNQSDVKYIGDCIRDYFH